MTRRMRTYEFTLSVEVDARDEEQALQIAKEIELAAHKTGWRITTEINNLEEQ